jgi:hypothetical protein
LSHRRSDDQSIAVKPEHTVLADHKDLEVNSFLDCCTGCNCWIIKQFNELLRVGLSLQQQLALDLSVLLVGVYAKVDSDRKQLVDGLVANQSNSIVEDELSVDVKLCLVLGVNLFEQTTGCISKNFISVGSLA